MLRSNRKAEANEREQKRDTERQLEARREAERPTLAREQERRDRERQEAARRQRRRLIQEVKEVVVSESFGGGGFPEKFRAQVLQEVERALSPWTWTSCRAMNC